MKDLRKLKIFVFMVLMFFGAVIGTKQVKAADGDIQIEITRKIETGYYRIYSYVNEQNNTLNELNGVSYDYKKQELTLNNCRAYKLNIVIHNTDFNDFTIVLKGTNILKSDYHSLVSVVEDESGKTKNINLVFKGDGNLYFYCDDEKEICDYIENRYGDVVVDGASLYMQKFHCGWSQESAIESKGFIMKSGKLDITVFPFVSEKDDNSVLFYYSTIINSKKKIDILGGTFNVTYRYPKDDYEKVIIRNNKTYVLDVYGYIPKGSEKINISIPDELKENIKLMRDYDIHFEITVLEGKEKVMYDDPNSLKGLSWDAKDKVLTMDNFECFKLFIYSDNIHNKISIKVKNKNNISCTYDGIDMRDVDVTLIGDGTITMNYGFSADYYSYFGSKNVDDIKTRLIIDGPFLNIKNADMKLDRLELKSGRIDMTVNWYNTHLHTGGEVYELLTRRSVMVLREGLFVYGGTMYIKMDKMPNKPEYYESISMYPVIGVIGGTHYTADDIIPEVIFENCTVIFVDKYGTNDFIDYYEDNGKDFEITKNENAVFKYVTDESELEKISIDDYEVKVLTNPCYYNGKPQTPKIQLDTLVEGVDYEVSYENNTEIGTAKAHINGIGLYMGERTVEFEIVKKKEVVKPKNEDSPNSREDDRSSIFMDKNFKYRIISEPSANAKYGKVEVVGLVDKNLKKVKIKNTVSFAGKKYKITSIAKKAFKNNNRIKSVIIGKNVTTIGSKAFYNCKKLSKVFIKSKKLKKIGKKAFSRKGGKKIKVSVPKKMKKKYIKLFKKAKIKKIAVK